MHNFAKYYVTIALLLVVAKAAKASAVLMFGWSDTDVAAVDEGLKNQGIESRDFKRSNSRDKGLGIAIVTRDKAEAYKNNCKKCFANIHTVLPGISGIGDLQVSFEEGTGENIEFGKSEDAYSGIFTDDPSKVDKGDAKGSTTSEDALWSTQNGKTAEIKMTGGGGREFVKMNAVIKGGTDGKPDDDDDDDKKPDDDDDDLDDEKPGAGLDKPCGGPKDRQCAEGLECVKTRDNPTNSISFVTHICKPKGGNSNPPDEENPPDDDKPPSGTGSKGNCRIAVLADQTFAESHGDNAEQAIKDMVKGTSDIVNDEFGITISIESIDFENGVSRRELQESVGYFFGNWSEKIPNHENLCFVLGVTSKDIENPPDLPKPGSVVGFSPVGVACQGRSMVVMTKDVRDFDVNIRKLTHELGHMLGADHDQDPPCGKSDRGVMHSPTMYTSEDIKFSQCSKNAITAKLPDYECLRNPDGKYGPSDEKPEKSGNAWGRDDEDKKQTKPEARKKNLKPERKP